MLINVATRAGAVAPAFAELRYVCLPQDAGLRQQLGGTPMLPPHGQDVFSGSFAKPAISGGYRPRGAAAPAPTARSQLNRDRPLRNGGRDRSDVAALPMLRPQISTKHATKFMTQ